jgi:hypothetical protein
METSISPKIRYADMSEERVAFLKEYRRAYYIAHREHLTVLNRRNHYRHYHVELSDADREARRLQARDRNRDRAREYARTHPEQRLAWYLGNKAAHREEINRRRREQIRAKKIAQGLSPRSNKPRTRPNRSKYNNDL